MSPKEIAAIEGIAHSVGHTLILAHAASRMVQKDVSEREIENCLKYGHAIEVHNEASNLRIVLRHDYGRPKVGVCLVLELGTNAIITVWKNKGNDGHKTLDKWQYQWNIDLVKLLGVQNT